MSSDERSYLHAMEETEVILKNDPSRNFADPTLPIFRAVAMEALAEEQSRWNRGDKVALLGAIRICANHDLVMPDWVSRAFIKSYDRVLNCRVGSWDDAFGRPFPQGKHLNALRKKRQKMMAVYLEVERRHKDGCAIGDLLFEEVGRSFGVGKTLASEFYYEGRKQWGESPTPSPLRKATRQTRFRKK